MKTQLLKLVLIVIALPAACTNPPVDCSAYGEQSSSPYRLPYTIGQSYKVEVSTGHYRESNNGVGLYSIDFNMPIGTKIVASRSGEVVAVQEKFEDYNGEDLKENYVFIRHNDGTIARYFHLTHQGALVSLGDKVAAGDVIGLSGNTGQSGGPHLHFDVQKCGPNLPPNYNKLPCGQTIPVTFNNTITHQCGVVEGKHYRADKS
ncbi:M23 family metallopeptidase [Pseudoalteromonas sp. S16_S37]|uniref:M23 family metallopeptidase n=1 Tax=Pseudoalteromonas sp. S16_S37 TaxID=2720228 RepID=UPI0016814241|nr:M23 family metallopeptidase [Pseudoalteromonas sp. S16_S37]MBD1583942.1 M23 family metallopeptidase [Pseudoalteromonas sp. S16_S37]